jgi:protoporphyrinogen oxidase
MKRIAIVGAGVGGMTAAYDLCRAGHHVTLFEAANQAGGLSAGFKDPHWDWWLEKFYHHWFLTDADMLGLIKELGLKDKVIIPHPRTVVMYRDKFYPLDSPLAALTFPGFTPIDMLRFGFVTAYLRYLARWQPLEKYTAHSWMQKTYGSRLYDTMFEPLLMGKFGKFYREVPMSWFWARFKARTTRLATFEGGFQTFNDLFLQKLFEMRVEIRLNTTVQKLEKSSPGLKVYTAKKPQVYDQVLITTSPAGFQRLAPNLPGDYNRQVARLKSTGAVILVLALKHQLSTEGYYWFNLPKAAGFPFLALVEHTNFLPPEHYGGDHIVYCGDYLEVEHDYFHLTKAQLLERFLPSLKRINSQFTPSWVRDSWLWKTDYGQPVPTLNQSCNIPPIQTPLPGLYFASMSQIYPWDRGTNFAVRLAHEAAREMIAEKV